MMPSVDVGVLLLPTDPWPETRARARRVEAMGYAHLWTYDHLTWRRYRDHDWHAAVPWLAGLAASTERIRLGTMVTSPNFRHPVTLAKEVMTLDHVSGGRFELGIGAGGIGFDATVFGDEPLSPAARAARLEEFVELLDALLRQPLTSYRGKWFVAHEAQMLPGCVQQPRVPLALAAAGRRTLALAARFADAWVTYGERAGPDATSAEIEAEVRAQSEQLDEGLVAAGRKPEDVRRIYMIGNTGERPLASTEAFVDFAGRYAALGFTDLVFHHPRPGDPVWTEPEKIVEEIAVDVLPGL